jgi:uncharacterized protein YndB with AHSA1/START domain
MAEHSASLTVRQAYACAPERVFDAWIDPAVTSRWLFRTPNGQNVRCDIDARPGGTFVITDRRAGEDVEHRGTYRDIDRPRLLVFTFSVPKYSSDESTVSVNVAPAGTGCELTLVNHDVPPEWARQSEQGWRDLLARLEALLHT